MYDFSYFPLGSLRLIKNIREHILFSGNRRLDGIPLIVQFKIMSVRKYGHNFFFLDERKDLEVSVADIYLISSMSRSDAVSQNLLLVVVEGF